MSVVSVSPKFQVVIPKDVRRQLALKPGQKVEVVVIDGVIHIVPVTPLARLRGRFPGIPTEVDRRDRDLP